MTKETRETSFSLRKWRNLKVAATNLKNFGNQEIRELLPGT